MSRRWRIETALSSLLRERSIATLDELITILVMGKEPSLSQRVVEALLNNETYFFRDRTPFDQLGRAALPALAELRRDSKRLRIWSAGCSTGQELYSIAMLFAGIRCAGTAGRSTSWAATSARPRSIALAKGFTPSSRRSAGSPSLR